MPTSSSKWRPGTISDGQQRRNKPCPHWALQLRRSRPAERRLRSGPRGWKPDSRIARMRLCRTRSSRRPSQRMNGEPRRLLPGRHLSHRVRNSIGRQSRLCMSCSFSTTQSSSSAHGLTVGWRSWEPVIYNLLVGLAQGQFDSRRLHQIQRRRPAPRPCPFDTFPSSGLTQSLALLWPITCSLKLSADDSSRRSDSDRRCRREYWRGPNPTSRCSLTSP